MPNAPPDPLPWDFSKAPAYAAQSDMSVHRPSHGSDPPRATSFLVGAPLTFTQFLPLPHASAPQQYNSVSSALSVNSALSLSGITLLCEFHIDHEKPAHSNAALSA